MTTAIVVGTDRIIFGSASGHASVWVVVSGSRVVVVVCGVLRTAIVSLHIGSVRFCISIHVGRVRVDPARTAAVAAGAIGRATVVVLGVGGENCCDDCNEEHKRLFHLVIVCRVLFYFDDAKLLPR